MRKNFFKLVSTSLLMAAVVLGTTSCSKEDGGGDDNGGMEGDAYISLSLTTGNVQALTKAGLDPGTPAEQKVAGGVYMLLYDKAVDNGDAKLRYAFSLKATNTDGETDFSGDDVVTLTDNSTVKAEPTNIRFISKARLVKRQDYQLVILLNVDETAHTAITGKFATVETNTLADLYTAMTATEAADFMTAGGVFMSNANGAVQVSGTTDLYAVDKVAEANAITVNVDRIVAKVGVKEKTGGATVTWGGTLGAVTWGLDVENEDTYLVRQFHYYKGGSEMETLANSGNSAADREKQYAKDPNMSSSGGNFTTLDELTGTTIVWTPSGSSTVNYIYTLENTMDLAAQAHADYKNYTTVAVVKAYITDPAGKTGVSDYYSFKTTGATPAWKVFTHAEALSWIANGFPADMAGLQEAIEADKNSGSPVFDFGVSTSPTGEYRNSMGIYYHPAGLNIYRVPIKHFTAGGSPDPRTEVYGHYGIVRNNVYHITINSFTGPGTSTSDEAYISADVNINDWYVRDNEEDLGRE